MNCNHCELSIETTQSGLINCPHCGWKVIINSIYNSNDKNIYLPEIEIEIKYHDTGEKKWERYYLDGKKHRENYPASTQYHKSGDKIYEHYYFNGKFHNHNGPAIIYYNEDRTIKAKHYYIHGKYIENKN